MWYYLSLIPEEPSYVPAAEAQSRALDVLHAFLRKKAFHLLDKSDVEIEVEVSDDIQFVDQGVSFESVSCPACGTEVEFESWKKWMDRSYESNFSDRSITMRCCGCQTDLNALRYDWPAGFARYVIRAVNPDIDNGVLPADKLSVLEDILGCKLRQIRTHW
jgi:hypothetical protein